MTQNSLVVYIGGQCMEGQQLCPLKKDAIYTVSSVYEEKMRQGMETCVKLYEKGEFAFVQWMFREIDPPREINLEELIKQEV